MVNLKIFVNWVPLMDILLYKETRLLSFLPFKGLRLLSQFLCLIIPCRKLPGGGFLYLQWVVPLDSEHKLLIMDDISLLPDLVHHMHILLFQLSSQQLLSLRFHFIHFKNLLVFFVLKIPDPCMELLGLLVLQLFVRIYVLDCHHWISKSSWRLHCQRLRRVFGNEIYVLGRKHWRVAFVRISGRWWGFYFHKPWRLVDNAYLRFALCSEAKLGVCIFLIDLISYNVYRICLRAYER